MCRHVMKCTNIIFKGSRDLSDTDFRYGNIIVKAFEQSWKLVDGCDVSDYNTFEIVLPIEI